MSLPLSATGFYLFYLVLIMTGFILATLIFNKKVAFSTVIGGGLCVALLFSGAVNRLYIEVNFLIRKYTGNNVIAVNKYDQKCKAVTNLAEIPNNVIVTCKAGYSNALAQKKRKILVSAKKRSKGAQILGAHVGLTNHYLPGKTHLIVLQGLQKTPVLRLTKTAYHEKRHYQQDTDDKILNKKKQYRISNYKNYKASAKEKDARKYANKMMGRLKYKLVGAK